MGLIAVGFLTFMVGTVAAAITEVVHPALVALAGFGIITTGGFLLSFTEPGASGSTGTTARLSVSKIACPNCGGAPSSVDDQGKVTCDYCGTRFILS